MSVRLLNRRLAKLERHKGDNRTFLTMLDGSTRVMRVPHKSALLSAAVRENRTGQNELAKELDLLARSVTVAEADGSHMAELARAILLSPQ
jgi:hypothetical protein